MWNLDVRMTTMKTTNVKLGLFGARNLWEGGGQRERLNGG
jgi:hypothetical protein